MSDERDEQEQPEGTISIDELARLMRLPKDEFNEYLIQQAQKAFHSQPIEPPEVPKVTVYEGVAYKHIRLEGFLYAGTTFNLNGDAPEVEYVGYSSETENLLVKPVRAHPQLMKREYLLVSRAYMREWYFSRQREQGGG